MRSTNAPAPTTAQSLAPNPFADTSVASGYEDWYLGKGRRADVLEKRLRHKLIATMDGVQTVLEVGCGTGHFTRWLHELGYGAASSEPSPNSP